MSTPENAPARTAPDEPSSAKPGPISATNLADAIGYAARLHTNQTRKGTETPYLAYLLAVASLVLENGGDEEQTIAGLLHDGPEDQGGQEILDEIRRRFGDRVADIVAECSDTFEDPKPPWQDRKESYLRHLKVAEDATFLVSAADKVHNLGCIGRDYRNLGEDLWGRFRASRAQTVWYYDSLTDIYESHAPSEAQPLAAELRLLLRELSRLIDIGDRERGKRYSCPIPGCSELFQGSRGGWDAHVASVRQHPTWEPGIEDPAARKAQFRKEFKEWFQ